MQIFEKIMPERADNDGLCYEWVNRFGHNLSLIHI